MIQCAWFNKHHTLPSTHRRQGIKKFTVYQAVKKRSICPKKSELSKSDALALPETFADLRNQGLRAGQPWGWQTRPPAHVKSGLKLRFPSRSLRSYLPSQGLGQQEDSQRTQKRAGRLSALACTMREEERSFLEITRPVQVWIWGTHSLHLYLLQVNIVLTSLEHLENTNTDFSRRMVCAPRFPTNMQRAKNRSHNGGNIQGLTWLSRSEKLKHRNITLVIITDNVIT